MKRQAVLLLAIFLGGCLPKQATEMAACQTEVMRFYPGYLAVRLEDPGTRFIIACMQARGYELEVAAADCNNRDPLATQPACYTPRHWFAAAIDRLRRLLRWD